MPPSSATPDRHPDRPFVTGLWERFANLENGIMSNRGGTAQEQIIDSAGLNRATGSRRETCQCFLKVVPEGRREIRVVLTAAGQQLAGGQP